MAKDRAFGSDAVSLIAKEVTYGTAPSGAGGGVYRQMPMRADTVGKERGLEDDPTWNRNSPEASDPSQGAVDVSGAITLPIDVQGAGFALTMALGASTVTQDGEDGPYTHVWKSGKDLFSYTRQLGHPKLTTPKWRTASGLVAGGLNFSMARSGRAVFEIPMTGQNQVKDTTGARDAAPLIYPYQPFDNAGGSVKLAGNAVANVTGASFALNNGIEGVEDINPAQQLSAIDPGARTLSGTINMRFGTQSAIDDLEDTNTSAALELAFALIGDATKTLKFQMPRTFFQLTKKPVEGPGGISVVANWRAALDAEEGYMLAVLLTNTVAAY